MPPVFLHMVDYKHLVAFLLLDLPQLLVTYIHPLVTIPVPFLSKPESTEMTQKGPLPRVHPLMVTHI